MDYEQAKELKDAGFPQEDALYYFTDEMSEDSDPIYYAGIENPSDEDIAAPTFEELIEACGSRFSELHSYSDGMWQAKSRGMSASEEGWCDVMGSTPTEAVAMLYLALYGKKQGNKDAGETSRMEGK